jgi:hypothetical protein
MSMWIYKNNYGETDALERGRMSIVQYLIDVCNADIIITNKRGENVYEKMLLNMVECQ